MRKIFLIICLLTWMGTNAQQWGLYTLYSVAGTNKAYLMDTNSIVYKTWTFASNKKTNFSSYLLPGDTLIRTVTYTGNIIVSPFISGEVQKVDWNNNVVWDFIYSTSSTVLHHDIHPLPNGNILMIALEVKSAADGTQAGASLSIVRHSDKIIEVQPTGPTTGNIVWEWKLWDHLCQNYDPTKDNYVTSISDNPQLININYDNIGDFIHTNGIDYNAALDQIAFSSYIFSEIFIIDHSTTTAEAAGHTGGNSGHGGDILYRWGNPAAYETSGPVDFDIVHNAHWLPADDPYFPNYLVGFNNKGGAGGHSCVDIFNPPYDGYNYSKTQGQAYAPATYAWRYTASCQSQVESSAQQLPNGNSLISLATCTTMLEVDHNGNTLWTFHPAGSVTNAMRYSECYVRGLKAFASASSPAVWRGIQDTLYSHATTITETNPAYTYSWTSIPPGFTSSLQNPIITPAATATYIVSITDTITGCSDTASVPVQVIVTGINDQPRINNGPVIYPNPASEKVSIEVQDIGDNMHLSILTLGGQELMRMKIKQLKMQLDVGTLPGGIYIVRIAGDKNVLYGKLLKK